MRRCGSRDLNKKQMDDSLGCTQIETVITIFYLHFVALKAANGGLSAKKVYSVKRNRTELHNYFVASLLN